MGANATQMDWNLLEKLNQKNIDLKFEKLQQPIGF